MAKRRSRHANEQTVRLSNFSGGLNLSVIEEQIADNELSQAENWEFSYPTGKLKTRDGLTLVKDVGVAIDTLFYADNIGEFLFSSGTTLYSLVGDTVTNLGTLSSSSAPQYALFKDKVLIASGGTLQSYDGATLADTGSPIGDIVFVRAGRAVVAEIGADTLIYSGVADETNWTTGTDADMVKIDVGQSDGGDITAIVALSTDVVVFKSSGSIFRVVNEYPDWVVYEITRTQTTLARDAVVQSGNNAYYLSPTGFMSLRAVQEYGDVKTSEEGFKVNTRLADSADSGAKVWNVASKGQIWVRKETSNYIWVYHTINKAWTYFSYSGTITAHTALDDGTNYVSMGTKIYTVSGYQDEGVDYICTLKLKKFTAIDQYLIKRMMIDYFREEEAIGSLSTGLLSLTFNISSSGDIAFEDDDIAYSDTDPLIVINENRLDLKSSYRVDYIEPIIQIESGSITLKEIIFKIVEV